MNEQILTLPEPNKIVSRFANENKNGKALDLGIGGGRDALYLAQLGYNVEAIDFLEKYSEKCNEIALQTDLNVKSRCEQLMMINIPQASFDIITSSWILHSMKMSDSHTLIKKLITGLKSKGMIIIAVFSIDDPFFKDNYSLQSAIEKNTFYSKDRKSYMHYFSKEEILLLFSKLELIYFSDSIKIDTGHGLPHYHGIIEYVGRKK